MIEWGNCVNKLRRGDVMKLFFSMLAIFFVTGCANMDLSSPQRWVEGNTFYSSKMPSVVIKVDENYLFQGKKKKDSLAESTDNRITEGRVVERSIFKDKRNRVVMINVDTVTGSGRLYMVAPDFDKLGKVFLKEQKKIGGMTFDTALIYIDNKGKEPFLTKMYTKIFGETSRLIVSYSMKADKEWGELHVQALPDIKKKKLSAFDIEANNSFALSSFNPTQHSKKGS